MDLDQAEADDHNFGRLYAGILIRADSISLVVGRKTKAVDDSMPFCFVPHTHPRSMLHLTVPTAREFPQTLSLIIASLFHLDERVIGIGIATYGPILSINIKQRNRLYKRFMEGHTEQTVIDDTGVENFDDHRNARLAGWTYGKISPSSQHTKLRELDIYSIVRNQLRAFGDPGDEVGVAIHTDVTCGALTESFFRRKRASNADDEIRRMEEDTVVFLNLAEGIGGGVVINRSSLGSANHPEMGYLILQLDGTNDTTHPTSESAAAQASHKTQDKTTPNFVEKYASLPAILKHTGKVDLKEIGAEDWQRVIGYIAQLCASITFAIGPHRIVLHGPIAEFSTKSAITEEPFSELVFEQMTPWLSIEGQQYVTYPEITQRNYILESRYVEWAATSGDSGALTEKLIDPMLYGALIYGAQTPPENMSKL